MVLKAEDILRQIESAGYRYYEFGDESVLRMDWDGSWPIIW